MQHENSESTPSVPGANAFQPSHDDMLDAIEACAMLKCEWLTLRGLLHDGTLPGLKISKEWVIPRRAFIDALNEKATQGAHERRNRPAETLGDDVQITALTPADVRKAPEVPHNTLHPRWKKYEMKKS
jgi:hypothetical protein